VPRHGAALRLLSRTLPAIGAGSELADLLEQASTQLPRAVGAELLARAAALVSDAQPGRSINLARRAAEMSRGLVSPRWLETWSTLAFRTNDFAQLSQALEARADSTSGSDAADLPLAGVDLALLRRLARLQLRRGELTAALAALVQIAEAVPEGNARAEACGRAAEVAEWRVGDPRRAIELYRAALSQNPNAAFAWA